MPSVPPSAGTEVAALTPDEICKRDGGRLERLRSSPTSEEELRASRTNWAARSCDPSSWVSWGAWATRPPRRPPRRPRMARRRMRRLGPRVVGTEHYIERRRRRILEVARKNSVARTLPLAYSWVTTDAAGHRWVHIRPIHYSPGRIGPSRLLKKVKLGPTRLRFRIEPASDSGCSGTLREQRTFFNTLLARSQGA